MLALFVRILTDVCGWDLQTRVAWVFKKLATYNASAMGSSAEVAVCWRHVCFALTLGRLPKPINAGIAGQDAIVGIFQS